MEPKHILEILAKIIHYWHLSNPYHAIIALSSNHTFSALALSSLLIADLRYRAISMALTGCKGGEERLENIRFYINSNQHSEWKISP